MDFLHLLSRMKLFTRNLRNRTVKGFGTWQKRCGGVGRMMYCSRSLKSTPGSWTKSKALWRRKKKSGSLIWIPSLHQFSKTGSKWAFPIKSFLNFWIVPKNKLPEYAESGAFSRYLNRSIPAPQNFLRKLPIIIQLMLKRTNPLPPNIQKS